MIGFFISLLSGVLMSVQGTWNTQLTKVSGIWTANAFVQLTAFLVCMAAWGIKERIPFSQLLQTDPKYMLAGGVLGAFITYTVIRGVSLLGPAKAVMVIVISQLTASYLIQLFGLFGMEQQTLEGRKLAGLALAIAGVIIFNK